MSLLAIRREVIDYGAIPLSSWLYHGDSPAAIQTLLLQLLEAGQEDGSRCECFGPSCSKKRKRVLAASLHRYICALCSILLAYQPALKQKGAARSSLSWMFTPETSMCCAACPFAGWVDVETLAKCLAVPVQHAKVRRSFSALRSAVRCLAGPAACMHGTQRS